MSLKMLSLFDGIGGFVVAGQQFGVETVAASEVEPFCIRVTKAHFPTMKHLGSVSDIDGAELEPVDICCFGSPCQDLSVAGKGAGIHDGDRSNLFFQAIRIIKEMREHDERVNGRTGVDVRPRFAVWENVPGAFSSNDGEDFRAVLEAFCHVCDPTVSIPRPQKGKWLPAGCVVGNDYSVAWRVLDAQYYGVPQRRARIYAVADFGSKCAGTIQFVGESMPWHSPQIGNSEEGTSDDAE